MGNRTAELTITFEVTKEDDEGWPWVAELRSIEPRGTGLNEGEFCGLCNGYVKGKRLCDACAITETIRYCGGEDWLKGAGVDFAREGVLTVVGYVEWWHFSGVDGDDWDEEAHVTSTSWAPLTKESDG